ncbi:hypothetical protein AGABI1DRAFT_134870 [Agaricus bisporus var. burnettii JB137-S8]|uniref:Uncharacterized protein n=1 Tax=Agaricus bisporus var. burnettii (strain JB137-S8 / ATCC MYA-4627 / FGSC 10392) TaxID=597362 RepID=K5XG71_AGABU|nr:uncharacterized protein AGABI1DRAFT_134870 [Agaricus bisporus var. burnettii JB137-S8]EKM73390.1 hypothetical protein AGABI1DRAFT_134870 [Agaricus bisporus var. burnettii JB137-S8]
MGLSANARGLTADKRGFRQFPKALLEAPSRRKIKKIQYIFNHSSPRNDFRCVVPKQNDIGALSAYGTLSHNNARKTVLERRDRLASEAPDALTNRPVASAPLTQTELRASIVEKVAAAGPSTRRLRPPRREGPLDAWLIRKESNPAERED